MRAIDRFQKTKLPAIPVPPAMKAIASNIVTVGSSDVTHVLNNSTTFLEVKSFGSPVILRYGAGTLSTSEFHEHVYDLETIHRFMVGSDMNLVLKKVGTGADSQVTIIER